MNTLERALQDELDRLVDRLAVVTAEHAERWPALQAQLDRVEARLSRLRLELLQSYDEWRDAIEECGDLWAMAALAADQPSDRDLRAA